MLQETMYCPLSLNQSFQFISQMEDTIHRKIISLAAWYLILCTCTLRGLSFNWNISFRGLPYNFNQNSPLLSTSNYFMLDIHSFQLKHCYHCTRCPLQKIKMKYGLQFFYWLWCARLSYCIWYRSINSPPQISSQSRIGRSI